MLLYAHGIRAYVDGMGRDVYKILKKHPQYLRNPDLLDQAFKYAISVNDRQRDSFLKEPSVIVTTAGMLNGGPILYYLSRLYKDPKSKVLLTGYQVEGTNGRLALEHGFVETRDDVLALKPKVEQYDFSAHSGDSDLKKVVNVTGVVDTTNLTTGQHILFVEGKDAQGKWGPPTAIYITISDVVITPEPTNTPEPPIITNTYLPIILSNND